MVEAVEGPGKKRSADSQGEDAEVTNHQLVAELLRRLPPADAKPGWRNPSVAASIVTGVVSVLALIFSVVSFYRTLPDPAHMSILTPKRIGVDLVELEGLNAQRIDITVWVPFVNKGGENAIVTNTVLLVADLERKTQPLLFEQYDRLPADFAPREAAVKTRFFLNGPYDRAQIEPSRTYELILLGFTDDTNQPSFGIRFHATYSVAEEDANFFVDSDREFDGLFKLEKKLGACSPALLRPAEFEATKVWQARTVPWTLYEALCKAGSE